MSNLNHKKLILEDLRTSLRHKNKLANNFNLLFWYRQLYIEIFKNINIDEKNVLEIGSGSSPLKIFHKSVITSDILPLDHLDLIFDCHNFSAVKDVGDETLDLITLTNVIHHLKDPIEFFIQARSKLKNGAQIIFAEPYISYISYPIYKYLHPEPIDLLIADPILKTEGGPLSNSNQALAHLIFNVNEDWADRISDFYKIEEMEVGHFTSLAYFLTGGISFNFKIPFPLYKLLFYIDKFLANCFPKLFASFFYVKLTAR